MSAPTPLRISGALVCAAAALLPAVAAAQIFECTDARGAREYAQICPAGTVRQREVQRPDEAPVAAPAGKSAAQEDAEFRKRQQERQDADAKAAADRAQAEVAERNCTQARNQLKALVDGVRMQRIDATGAAINLGDDERAADAARQQALVDQWCK